jgi:hypothetical protein
MEAQQDFKAYAVAEARARRNRGAFALARPDTARETYNARGLVVAVSMSAACWAAIGLAFLL